MLKYEYRTLYNEDGKWKNWTSSSVGIAHLIEPFFTHGAEKVTIKYPTYKIQYRRVEQ